MKLSWPFCITVAFISFAVFIGILVTKTYFVNTELVYEDYYNRELQYEERLSQIRRVQQDSIQVVWKLTGDDLILQLVNYREEAAPAGTVEFYRPSQASRDVKIPLKMTGEHTQHFATSMLAPGLYHARVQWQSPEGSYYSEQEITVN